MQSRTTVPLYLCYDQQDVVGAECMGHDCAHVYPERDHDPGEDEESHRHRQHTRASIIVGHGVEIC